MTNWIPIILAVALGGLLIYALVTYIQFLKQPWDEWDADDETSEEKD